VVHRTVTVHCPVRLLAPALTSARAVRDCSLLLYTFAVDRWRYSRYSAWHIRQSGATLDSPVNYSGVAFLEPEGGEFGVDLPGAPDSRCARPGQSSVGFASFYLNPFLDFLLVCVEPLAPVELIV
jgi:hypothetical protein